MFNENKKQKLIIDKLKLALNNNILKLEFSPDSKCLLIHMNYRVFVINVDNGKCIIKLNTAYRPVNKVYFTADSKQLVLILCNNTKYIYDLCVNGASCRNQIPDKLDFGQPIKFCVNNNPSSNNRILDCGAIRLSDLPRVNSSFLSVKCYARRA